MICECSLVHLKNNPSPCLNGTSHDKACPCKIYQEELKKNPDSKFTYYPPGTFPKKEV